jgi:hypothetical protein
MSFIESDALEALRGSALYYPSAGNDCEEPVAPFNTVDSRVLVRRYQLLHPTTCGRCATIALDLDARGVRAVQVGGAANRPRGVSG